MKILAFDTCLDKMYVALGENGELLDSKIVKTTESNYHSAFLISTIKDILRENHLTPQDIDVVATNIGPGSFTGIRACTTVARVFAQGMGIKTVGISSLEILSKITLEEEKGKRKKEKEESKQEVQICSPVHLFTLSPSKTLVALDARKEMAYVAIFDSGKQILAPQTISIAELKELIAKEDYFIVTDNRLEPILGGISYQKQDDDLGQYLIQITAEKINTDFDTDWRKLLPLYIQPPAVNKG